MTQNTKASKTDEKRKIISFEPTEENFQFLDEKKQKHGTPYTFTIEKALETQRKKEKWAPQHA